MRIEGLVRNLSRSNRIIDCQVGYPGADRVVVLSRNYRLVIVPGMLIKSLATRRIQSRSVIGMARSIARNRNPYEVSCGGALFCAGRWTFFTKTPSSMFLLCCRLTFVTPCREGDALFSPLPFRVGGLPPPPPPAPLVCVLAKARCQLVTI